MENFTFQEVKLMTAHILANGEINYRKLLKYVNLDKSIEDVYNYVKQIETSQHLNRPLNNAQKLIIWSLQNKKFTAEQRRRMSKQILSVKEEHAFEVECYQVFRQWFT